jgi:hypothetical protein
VHGLLSSCTRPIGGWLSWQPLSLVSTLEALFNLIDVFLILNLILDTRKVLKIIGQARRIRERELNNCKDVSVETAAVKLSEYVQTSHKAGSCGTDEEFECPSKFYWVASFETSSDAF